MMRQFSKIRSGGGIAQEIDGTAMTLNLKCQHLTGVADGAATLTGLVDIDFISAGAIINL